jgi:hypothetical protein
MFVRCKRPHNPLTTRIYVAEAWRTFGNHRYVIFTNQVNIPWSTLGLSAASSFCIKPTFRGSSLCPHHQRSDMSTESPGASYTSPGTGWFRWHTRVYSEVSGLTACLELELQMVQLSATRCSCIAILWVSLVSFAAITLCVTSQRVLIVVSVYFVIDSVRKLWIHPHMFSEG